MADPVAPVRKRAAPVPTPAAVAVDAAPAAPEETVMDTTPINEAPLNDAKAMFGEAAERAQSGMAKGQAMFADMGDFGKGNLDALAESTSIAAKGFEAIGKDAAAFLRGQFEEAQAQARSLSTVTSPTEFVKMQSEFARTTFDKMLAEASRNTEAMLKLAGEIAQPLSNRMALAADKVKSAA